MKKNKSREVSALRLQVLLLVEEAASIVRHSAFPSSCREERSGLGRDSQAAGTAFPRERGRQQH